MKTTGQKKDNIARTRKAAQMLLECRTLNEEYVYGDLGNVLVDGDFTDEDSGIILTDYVAFYGATMTAIMALLDTPGIESVLSQLAAVGEPV